MRTLSQHENIAASVMVAAGRSTLLTRDAFSGAHAVLIDFFSGCGGTSEGFRQAGIPPIAAVENEAVPAATYELNFPDARMFKQDVRTLDPDVFLALVQPHRDAGRAIIVCACAPCQPFSRQRRGDGSADERVDLLAELLRFLTVLRPDAVFVENVPGLRTRADDYGPFHRLRDGLRDAGYVATAEVVASRDHGIPQTRRRLVVLAGLGQAIAFPPITHGVDHLPYVTVGDAIAAMPALAAGESDDTINGHAAADLSEMNLRRIRATPEGGGWKDWPDELRLACHRDRTNSYTDTYGRLRRDGTAPAVTTRCDSLSNGRFGHPTQDRAITPREAAALQTFPPEFTFVGPRVAIAKQVGNAVPVRLAEAFGTAILSWLTARTAKAA
jgi:DNA (cytosine-5)-methyltransferase 1